MTTEANVLHELRTIAYIPTIEDLRRLALCSRRDIEAAIETLRLEGHPIIADAHGVRLTNDPDELARYLEARRRRLVSQYKGTRALRLALRRLRRDPTLWDVA
jgi:hypothetical protein